MIIVISVSFSMLMFCFFMLHRNNVVYKTRISLNKEIHVLNMGDIANGKDINYYEWRYERFDEYSYGRMMWQLFKFRWTLAEVLKVT